MLTIFFYNLLRLSNKRFGIQTPTKKKKKNLLRRAKSAAEAPKPAAKGTFDLWWRVLLRQFFLPSLRCHYKSIVAVTKNATVDTPFSGSFGLLRRA